LETTIIEVAQTAFLNCFAVFFKLNRILDLDNCENVTDTGIQLLCFNNLQIWLIFERFGTFKNEHCCEDINKRISTCAEPPISYRKKQLNKRNNDSN
jgi:hypothetical protein